MEPGGSVPHLQGLSNNSYPEPNQPNSPHWVHSTNIVLPSRSISLKKQVNFNEPQKGKT